MSTKYRFKNHDEVSGWLLVDALKEAARSKIITAETVIQQAGRDDWVSAGKIPGLIPRAAVAVIAAAEVEPIAHPNEHNRISKVTARPAESIHHLLHRVLHHTIQVCARNDEHRDNPILSGTLTALTMEGLMIEFAEFDAIAYIPFTRIRAAVISKDFPAAGLPRHGEIVRIEVDSLPSMRELDRSPAEAARAVAV